MIRKKKIERNSTAFINNSIYPKMQQTQNNPNTQQYRITKRQNQDI